MDLYGTRKREERSMCPAQRQDMGFIQRASKFHLKNIYERSNNTTARFHMRTSPHTTIRSLITLVAVIPYLLSPNASHIHPVFMRSAASIEFCLLIIVNINLERNDDSSLFEQVP